MASLKWLNPNTGLVEKINLGSDNVNLKKANNLSDLNSVPAARTSLGLGDAATKNVGTTAGTVAAGDLLNQRDTLMPTGALRQTFDRTQCYASSTGALTSGRINYTAIVLKAGDVISNITFYSGGTAAAGTTYTWFALYSSTGARLGITANDTSGWAASTAKTLALGSAYTVPTTGIYYLGTMVVATTMPTFSFQLSNTVFQSLAPIIFGQDDTNTGQTVPGSAPNQLAMQTAAGRFLFGTVN